MVNYDVFAEFYDPVMGERTDNIKLIQGLIKQYNPQAESVLELATGTGSVIKGLADKYQVSGLDLSTEMLNKAKLKIPKAELHQRDMADFNIGKTFDVIICVFDSINHLESFDRWQQMFSATYRHLNTGGIFIFDMNTIGRLRRLATEPSAIRDFNAGRLVMKVHQLGKNSFDWEVKVFEQLSGKLHEEHITEVAFPLSDVQQSANVMFQLVSSFSLGGEPLTDDSDRAFFVYRKR